MMKLPNDFKDKSTGEVWYDLREDWGLVEASIAKQYGLRIRHHTDMPWDEFCTLVGGLMPDTPLGQIVTIRAEKDPKIIKNFTPDQKRIHRDWQKRLAMKRLENPDKLNKDMEALGKMFAAMFGKKKA
ncbi:Gp15 family bacteriophage protein [Petroclostridium sp. X23]|uniref:Gp15 family bacteriophage protein n=1 Tax=Petroclostridium sp. X23 TaxID=3045146 RepID=UPI0024ADBAC0|nr:Gp15 family bacteriophage protein [Petroclostridium sp. X23]WHH58487.1 Gp15 family bacteriophage protein [Petroclostridium sp. X23]